jgi:hypothetical protein
MPSEHTDKEMNTIAFSIAQLHFILNLSYFEFVEGSSNCRKTNTQLKLGKKISIIKATGKEKFCILPETDQPL